MKNNQLDERISRWKKKLPTKLKNLIYSAIKVFRREAELFLESFPEVRMEELVKSVFYFYLERRYSTKLVSKETFFTWLDERIVEHENRERAEMEIHGKKWKIPRDKKLALYDSVRDMLGKFEHIYNSTESDTKKRSTLKNAIAALPEELEIKKAHVKQNYINTFAELLEWVKDRKFVFSKMERLRNKKKKSKKKKKMSKSNAKRDKLKKKLKKKAKNKKKYDNSSSKSSSSDSDS